MLTTRFRSAVTFGSNAQPVDVAIDTGSDELFVDPNCDDRDFTSDEVKECEATGSYNNATSTTAKSTGENSQIVYGSGAVDITYIIDSIGIPGASQNLTAVQFGKATASQDLNEGILGLGFGNGVNLNYSNLVDALQEQGVTKTKAFSVALGTSDTAGGSIIFGGVDTKKFAGTLASLPIAAPAKGDIQRYAVSLSSISFTNSSGTSKYANSALSGVVLDTGSSLCELPTAIVAAMAADVGAVEDEQSGLLAVSCSVQTSGSQLEFAFDGVTIAVPMSDFVLSDGGNSCVLGVQPLQAGSGITALLGDTFLRNAYVVFDQTNMKIGMAQYAACGTNEQVIQTGSDGAVGFTGECTASTTTTATSSKSAAASDRGRTSAVLAVIAGMAALVSLF